MIKVNLLESVTDRARSVAVVEERVSNPRARSWLLISAVFSLLALGMAFDYVSANMAHSRAQAELERQQQIAAQMAAINKEQADLEKKIKDTQTRIDVIKKLRASQQGPVALLSSINDRLPALAEFRLEFIEQKNGELTIEGHSPNEAAITQFGRSLEFSSGNFTNVSIETEKKEMEVSQSDYDPKAGPLDLTIKPETMKFKIRCRFTPTAPAPQNAAAAPGQSAPNQVAQK
jgi:Tfp pilus assembly protein PilN